MQRPRPFASTSDFGFPSGAEAAAPGAGPAQPNNNPSFSAARTQDPPSPRKLKHGRTTSVPNLHKLSTGASGAAASLSHSRSRSWLASFLKPERGQAASPVPPLPGQRRSPPASPSKGTSVKGKRGTLGGTLRRKVEDGLGLPFAGSERGRLEFGCMGRESMSDDRVEELVDAVVEAPKRPQRPREELDQGKKISRVGFPDEHR